MLMVRVSFSKTAFCKNGCMYNNAHVHLGKHNNGRDVIDNMNVFSGQDWACTLLSM